jgi:hypothetical protein
MAISLLIAETVSEWQTSYLEQTNSPTDNVGNAAGRAVRPAKDELAFLLIAYKSTH